MMTVKKRISSRNKAVSQSHTREIAKKIAFINRGASALVNLVHILWRSEIFRLVHAKELVKLPI